MNVEHRKYNLAIWGLALGYFLFYIPYSALIKVITSGKLPGMSGPVSGFELLPVTVVATAVGMFGFITAAGWWKYAGRRKFFGLAIPFPNRWTFLSGVGFTVIIGTTTLAYTFEGVSIIFALLLMRGGVLIMSPIIDTIFKRRVRWFSWIALSLSILALAIAFADVNNYELTIAAGLNLAAYLSGYMLRLPCMTTKAKCDDQQVCRRYFVEEQIVAMPILVALPATLAFIGKGESMLALRRGFTTFLESDIVIPSILIGLFYAGLAVCGTLIYLDRREHTFCIPLNRCSSLLSGIVASYALAFTLNQPTPSVPQLISASIIVAALLALSPLHHAKPRVKQALAEGQLRLLIYVSELARRTLDLTSSRIMQVAIAGNLAAPGVLGEGRNEAAGYYGKLKRVLLFVCGGNTCRSPMAEAISNAEISSRLNLPFNNLDRLPLRALSAGISAKDNMPMSQQAQDVLQRLGIPLYIHSSRALTGELVNQAEVVYCMTHTHRDTLIKLHPSAAWKTKCLDPNGDIEDPTGFGEDKYVECAKRIQNLVRRQLDRVGIKT
jgi:protein-tyrosine-phosphatase